MKRAMYFFLAMIAALLVLPTSAQEDADPVPPAQVINDEGGVQRVQGSVAYTVEFIRALNRGALSIVLYNEALYVDRDFEGLVPTDWQALGYITSDVYVSPFSYELILPSVPPGPARDVDNDAQQDVGVHVFSLFAFTDFRESPYLDGELEYTAGLNAAERSTTYEYRYDYVGGKLLVWAPDAAQGFPSGFGADGFLFTEDDPIMRLPAGWSVVDLDSAPFSLDRSATAQVDLIEQEQSLQPADYSDLGYTLAFDALHLQMREEYAFTELKGVNWDALYDEFAPRFAQAEADNDSLAYQRALLDFAWAIPDGHIGASVSYAALGYFEETDGGLGLAVRELDDGRIIAHYVTEDGPAGQAGMQRGDEIVAINGAPPLDRVGEINIWLGPFSSDHVRRLQELRHITRFRVGETVTLSFVPAAGAAPQTVTLTAIAERGSWNYSDLNNGRRPGWALPLEFEITENGYGLMRVNTFSTNPELMFRLVEHMIDALNENAIPGLIIDMRQNSGGFNLDRWMAGYFFDHEVVIGYDALYYTDVGDFVIDRIAEERIVPPSDGRHYSGQIVLLTGPSCASACEFFSYNMTLQDRATVVGFYPSAGLGGNITPVRMPDGVSFQFTIGRALDADENIRLEGIGVQPDVRVPLTVENVLYDGDIEMEIAERTLAEMLELTFVQGDDIVLGEARSGDLRAGQRVRFEWVVESPGFYDIIVSSEDETLDTVLNIYLADNMGRVAVSNDDLSPETSLSGFRGLEVPGGLDLVLEVAGFIDGETGPFTLTVAKTGTLEPDDNTMANLLAGQERFSVLWQMVQAVGLEDALVSPGAVTLFAPPDAAFLALFDRLGVTLDDVLDQEALLLTLLGYHLVDGSYSAADLVTLRDGELVTFQGEAVKLSGDEGALMLNGDISLVEVDIQVSNGIVHEIDAVLLPEAIFGLLAEVAPTSDEPGG